MDGVCCLLHNLIVGGSARQWEALLSAHVERGSRATVVAPPGPMSARLREAGIETVELRWDGSPARTRETVREALAGHDVAVVHWDRGVMDALGPARDVCGRVVLTAHQAPSALSRWSAPEAVDAARRLLADALEEPRTAVLVCGEWHRRLFAEDLDLPTEGMRILPSAISVPAPPANPASEPATEILALMRLAPDKEAVAKLAIELARAQAEQRPTRLTIAGDGPWRRQLAKLCRARLPAGSWGVVPAPRDPLARLAAADLVVSQGLTTLEAAALERRVVVARTGQDGAPAGVVLRPERYDVAAGDPFGRPQLDGRPARLLDEAGSVTPAELAELRTLVAANNSVAEGTRALAEAIAAIG